LQQLVISQRETKRKICLGKESKKPKKQATHHLTQHTDFYFMWFGLVCLRVDAVCCCCGCIMAWIARLVLGFVLLLLLFSFAPPLGSWNQISVVAAAASAPCPTHNFSTPLQEGGYLHKSDLR
jgi:hypothetical protein